ncbi:hypothetical protein KBC04_01275 [Candidatus Babeliales bacterium]|nr:hypothetical protein [Candidatus Babeliales bacterium]MBP9843642.1 hypothetical protein [Candidatus Babeliales bacterium]
MIRNLILKKILVGFFWMGSLFASKSQGLSEFDLKAWLEVRAGLNFAESIFFVEKFIDNQERRIFKTIFQKKNDDHRYEFANRVLDKAIDDLSQRLKRPKIRHEYKQRFCGKNSLALFFYEFDEINEDLLHSKKHAQCKNCLHRAMHIYQQYITEDQKKIIMKLRRKKHD